MATVGTVVSASTAVLSKGVVGSGVLSPNELVCDSVLANVAGSAGATVGLLSV